jgi:PhnB protein
MSTETNTPTTGITGDHTTDGRPHGFSSITPFLVIPGSARALEFYRDVYGATIGGVTEMPGADGDPIVVHAEVLFPDGRIQIGDPNPTYGLIPSVGDGHTVSYSMGLYVTDVDSTVERAVAAGAVVREEAQTFVSGDRFASIIDPFGVRWSIMTRVEDLTEEESTARVAEWAAAQ